MREFKAKTSFRIPESLGLENYLNKITQYPRLTKEEEHELFKEIKNDPSNKDARNKLVESNLLFVVSIARQFQNQGLSLADLINEGNLGVIKAAERFDAEKGYKFISYAVWWIRQSIMQALAEKSKLVTIPYNKVKLLKKIDKFAKKFESREAREPMLDELKEIESFTTYPNENTEEAMKMWIAKTNTTPHIPLDNTENEQETIVLPSSIILSPDYKFENGIEEYLSILTDEEKELLEKIYIQGIPVAHIAKEINKNEATIRARRDKILEKIRKEFFTGK